MNSALGYVCYNLILDAITRAGSDNPEAITKALAETKNFATPSARFPSTPRMTPNCPVGIIQYKNGKRSYIGEAIAD